jgi:hypothetical protein
MEHLAGMVTALDAVTAYVTSALPGAPVVPERPRHRRPTTRTDAVRRGAAALLLRAAAGLAPDAAPTSTRVHPLRTGECR